MNHFWRSLRVGKQAIHQAIRTEERDIDDDAFLIGIAEFFFGAAKEIGGLEVVAGRFIHQSYAQVVEVLSGARIDE